MQYIVCTSDIWWHSIDIKVMYQTAVMDVDKRLKVPYYEMPYTEGETTATRCHTSFVGNILKTIHKTEDKEGVRRRLRVMTGQRIVSCTACRSCRSNPKI